MSIPVQYTNSQSEAPVAVVSFEDFTAAGFSFPTGRVLDGSDDHGNAEEWAEPGFVSIDGEKRSAECMYLFKAEEIAGISEPEDYPWDADHVARIILQD